MDNSQNVMLQLSWNKINRCILYVVICTEISDIEIFSPIDQVPLQCTYVSRAGESLFIFNILLTLYM
jgi:hypothetical protein